LHSAGQPLRQLLFGEAELLSQDLDRLAGLVFLPIGRKLKKRPHHGLELRNRHRPLLMVLSALLTQNSAP